MVFLISEVAPIITKLFNVFFYSFQWEGVGQGLAVKIKFKLKYSFEFGLLTVFSVQPGIT